MEKTETRIRLSEGYVRLLLALFFVLYLVVIIGISLLLFATGEPKVLLLGSSGENIPLEISLFHLKEVNAGGDYTYVVGGVTHRYAVTSVGERVGHALFSFFRFDFGLATCMNNVALSSVIGASLLGSTLGLCFILLGVIVGFAAKFLPKLRCPHWLSYALFGIFAVLAFASPLFSNGVLLPSAFLGLAALSFLFFRANKKGPLSLYFRDAFFAIGALWVALHFIGLYIPVAGPSYPLSSLWLEAVRNGDNHTYTLSFFLMAILTALPIFAAFLCISFHKRKEGI